MKYERLPPNITLFSPTLFGFDYGTLMIMIPLAFATLIVLKLYPIFSVVPAIATISVAILGARGKSITWRPQARPIRSNYGKRYIPAFPLHAGDGSSAGLFRSGGKMLFIARVDTEFIIEMRENDQLVIMDGLKKLLSDLTVDADFYAYSGIREINGGKAKVYLVTSVSSGSPEVSRNNLSDISRRFLEGIGMLGFTYHIPDELEMQGLFSGILGGKDSRNGGKPSLRFRQNFISGDRNVLLLNLRDSRYLEGPAIYAFLDGSTAGSVVRISLRRMKDEEALKFLRRSRADRRAQIKMSGETMRGSGIGVSAQIEALNEMEDKLKRNMDPLFDVSMVISILAPHPTDLTEQERRYQRTLRYLGLDFRTLKPGVKSLSNLFPSGVNAGSHYIMNASSLATIIPVSFDPCHEGNLLIGTDDLNGRDVYLSVKYGSANNFIIFGETGSGKSFFTSLLMRRMIFANLLDCLYIYDPLDEYRTEEFQTREGLEVRIFRRDGMDSSGFTARSMNDLYSLMTSDQRRKAIVIEESHTVVFSDESRRVLEQMVRHSRHYNTIILSITQNVDDMTRYANSSIALNSSHIFLFRTRKISQRDLVTLRIDGFDSIEPQLLMGGKGLPYSECYFSDGKLCRKIRIMDE